MDVWRHIFDNNDIITATVLSVTCKDFRAIYLRQVLKVGIELPKGEEPNRPIPLNYTILFPDKQFITLRSCLDGWKGPNLQWNPYAERWSSMEQMKFWCGENGGITQACEEMMEELECDKEMRHEKRHEAKMERQSQREMNNEERAQRRKDNFWYKEGKFQYDNEDSDAEEYSDSSEESVSEDESVDSGEDSDSEEEEDDELMTSDESDTESN